MITLTHTTDMDLVRKIMTTPEIWSVSVEDGVSKDCWFPGFDELCGWLLCELDGEIVGLILVHNDNNTTIKIHPYMFNRYKRYSRDMMVSFFRWFIDSGNPAINKICVSIPTCRKVVYNFAKKVGFKDEGVNRASYTSGGEIHDQWLLGLTREEIKGLLWEAY